jgi:hypothetical protein
MSAADAATATTVAAGGALIAGAWQGLLWGGAAGLVVSAFQAIFKPKRGSSRRSSRR